MRLAICIISYNRPDSVKRCLKAIVNGIYLSDTVDLIISIDYSGKNDVKRVAEEFQWTHGKKKIIAHTANLGLRRHVLSCGDLTTSYDGLIVLEDDIYVAPSFYFFAKACVQKYAEDNNIAGISLYSFSINYHNLLPFSPLPSDSDVYLMKNAQSWGQVWMPRQWKAFKDWYNQNSEDFPEMPHLPKSICSWKKSWLKFHTRYCIEENKYFIYPYISLSTCFSDTGEHTNTSSARLQVPLCPKSKIEFNLQPKVCYDSFFENEELAKVLKIKEIDLCIDIYGEKQNQTNCRYWLTREIRNYKIISSYDIQFRPFEVNIINDLKGNQLFLYDTFFQEDNFRKGSEIEFIEYIYNQSLSIRRLARLFCRVILSRFISIL